MMVCGCTCRTLHGTQLWASCAHGRPTTAPLVDLPALLALRGQRGAARQGLRSLVQDAARAVAGPA